MLRQRLLVEVVAVADDLAVADLDDPDAGACERTTRRLVVTAVGAREWTSMRSASAPLLATVQRPATRNVRPLAVLSDEIVECPQSRFVSASLNRRTTSTFSSTDIRRRSLGEGPTLMPGSRGSSFGETGPSLHLSASHRMPSTRKEGLLWRRSKRFRRGSCGKTVRRR